MPKAYSKLSEAEKRKRREYARKRYEDPEIRARINARRRARWGKKDAAKRLAYYYQHREQSKALLRQSALYRKCRLLAAYCPDGVCQACKKVHDPRLLTIDHVHDDGAQERKTLGGARLLNKLLREPVSDRYQIYCWNCNWLKRLYGPDPRDWVDKPSILEYMQWYESKRKTRKRK